MSERQAGPWMTIPEASFNRIVEEREHARAVAVALENKVAALSDENAMLCAESRELAEHLDNEPAALRLPIDADPVAMYDGVKP